MRRVKKRLLIVIGCLGVGGAEHMIYELAKNVDRSQFEVNVLCYNPSKGTEEELQMEQVCSVTYLDTMGNISPKCILSTLRAIRKLKPDIVHAHLGGVVFGAIWTLVFQKPLVITIHAKPQETFNRKIQMLVKAALRCGKAKLVAVSAENEKLVKEYYQLDGIKCASVNNGIDLNRFFRRKHGCFTLVNAARHNENKNQASLIRCFAKLYQEAPDIRLLLLGDGPDHEMLIQLASELGVADAVTFTGNVINTEDFYSVSDLYVQSSFTEAMPLSVLEAMAAGLPIVSTNVGGLPDVVQDNGILVPAGDDDALYAAIKQIYTQSKEATEAMGQASLQIVQDYSSEYMARAYEKIYLEMCK